MAAGTSAPPLIAPGIKCPKCGGNMLDERQSKRSDKSPDYTCANLTCVETKNGKSYRTAIWAEKNSNGATPAPAAPTGVSSGSVGAPAGAESKPKMRDAYKSLTEWVLKEIAPLYLDTELEMSAGDMAACVQTLFIQACKAGKVE